MVFFIVRNFLKIIRPLFFPLKIYGLENVPKKGGCIFAPNHLSYIDPPLVSFAQPRSTNFVARDTLFKGVLAWLLPRLQCIPIKRETGDIGAIKEIFKRLKQGRPIVIFPEGTRTLDPLKRKILSGVGMIAVKTGVPVIPVLIKGTDKVLPPGAKRPQRQLVTVIFGAPMSFSREENYEEVSAKVMDRILSLV